ncbi:MAG: type II secretion system F family protein [Armatimonadetes bacterium]|nr:type II secretion system F family protein [Armatimonadota bacterium]
MLIYGLCLDRDREAVAELIQAEVNDRPRKDPYAEKLKQPITHRLLLPALQSLSKVIASIAPKGVLQNYEKMLAAAGYPLGLSPELFGALKLISLGLGLAATAGALRLHGVHPLLRRLALVLPLAIGLLLPDFLLQRRIADRRREFSRVLPDVVDLLVVGVEAGMSLDGAVQEVVNRRQDAAAEELAQVLSHIRVGVPRAKAWQALGERVPLQEVTTFTAAIIQAEQLGTSIGQVLRAQSDAIRTRRSLLIREHAAKMPVKMLIPMIFFIFPCVFIVILGPGAIRIFHAFAHL